MAARPKCAGTADLPGCGHVEHRDECPAKGPSACMPLLDPSGTVQVGIACQRGVRWPCPCPWGMCHTCRAPVIGASTLPLGEQPEIDLDPGPARDGTWAARLLADGTVAIRDVADRLLADGEWPARQHEHQVAGALP